MNTQIKKNIKLLCEKFNHKISYDNENILINNSVNEIQIIQLIKKNFQLKYNCITDVDFIDFEEFEIYDLLINIFQRIGNEKITKSKGEIITLETFKTEEYFSQNEIENLFEDLKNITEDYKDIGGNRILYEFYKGSLIFRDDLGYYKSNVIEIKK